MTSKPNNKSNNHKAKKQPVIRYGYRKGEPETTEKPKQKRNESQETRISTDQEIPTVKTNAWKSEENVKRPDGGLKNKKRSGAASRRKLLADKNLKFITEPKSESDDEELEEKLRASEPVAVRQLPEDRSAAVNWVGQPLERHDDGGEVHELYEPSTIGHCTLLDYEEDSDEFNTDIEEEFIAPPPAPYDTSGRDVYERLCKTRGLVPMSGFISKLRDKKFILRYHGFNTEQSKCVSEALTKNTFIEELDLTGNDLRYEGGSALVRMLYENTYISDLNLSDNVIKPQAGIEFAVLLAENTTIKRLILKGNHFNDHTAKAFAESLRFNRTLLELDLSYNEFAEQGALYIGAGVAMNYGLRVLNLKWNSINGKGGVALAAALKSNDCLTSLNVSWNGLGFMGALAFGRHMVKNEVIKELDISNNRIGPNGALKLAPAVARCTALQSLKIGLNPIGDEGVMHILKAAQKNPNIKLIGLEDITVSEETYKVMMEMENSRDITFITGGLGGYSRGKPPPSGINLLVQFIQDNRLRLTDLFFQWDKDKSGEITRNEFERGLKESGLKMDRHQLEACMDMLDTNRDGKISFQELLAGRDSTMLERRFERKTEIRTKDRENESMKLPKLKGF